MPHRNSWSRRLIPGRHAWDEWDDREHEARQRDVEPVKPRRRRAATVFAFAALFCAGASLSALAGNGVRDMLDSGSSTDALTATTDTTTTPTTDPAPAPPPPPDPGPAPVEPAPAPAPANPAPPMVSVTPDAGDDSGYGDHGSFQTVTPTPESGTAKAHTTAVSKPATRQIRASGRNRTRLQPTRHANKSRRTVPKRHPVDLEGATAATVWLNRALPDPTPPALRLRPQFASRLYRVSRQKGADWALVLGVLRAEGRLGSAPAGRVRLVRLATRLARLGGHRQQQMWQAAFAFSGGTSFADEATALAHYYRAVGLRALVRGLEAEKLSIAKRLLSDRRVSIYSAGRGDVAAGRVNVRVTSMLEYLADSFGQVSVSCLISGHRLYARPGVVSAHIYGLAADISAVGGTSILGHQQAGSATEQAVRALLLLPPEMMPRQVISLLGLGGPSFPLANHYNHIHVGY